MFGTKEATAAGLALIELRGHYSNPPRTERGLDPIFFGYITAAHPHVTVSRQMNVKFAKKTKPSRIDFRLGGTNPTVLELAVRPESGGQQLSGQLNRTELLKLSKIVPSKAKRRILLLIDLKKTPITRNQLEPTYAALNAGPGKKARHAVTVVYVHGNLTFSFTWKPRKP